MAMTLRDYQENISIEAAKRLREYGCCYLAMECRTGKTLTALAAASKYGAASVLFLTKLKAISSVKGDYDALNPPYSIEITNYESAHKLTGAYDFVILDEAHCLGAYPKPSKRTVGVKKLCAGLPVLYLSGTPTPESYSQLYHQLWVCSRSPFTKFANFYKWARSGFVDIRQKKVNGYTLNDYSHADSMKIAEATRHLFLSYSQEDAGFSCDIEERELYCSMTLETKGLINRLKRRKILEFPDGGTVLGDTPVKLMSKLHQLSGGTVITEDNKHLIIDESKALCIRDAFRGKKIAVFYVYKSEFDLLCGVFPDWTDNPEEFQRSNDRTFISQVRRAREGVRLDTAEAIVFYNLEFSFLSYEQGKNRIMSKERSIPAPVYFAISDCGIDGDVLEAVRDKKDFTSAYYVKRYGKS